MPLVINSNIAALNSQRQLVKSGDDLMQAMERLSSGKRINTAADDAAGLAISNRQTSQILGLNQAVRNANDGISMIQTAEGALDESTNILQRMRQLSIQSANGIYTGLDRSTLDAEVQQLKQELDRIAETTTFNGRALLDGSVGNVVLQVGSEANQTIDFTIAAMDTDTLGASAGGDVVGNTFTLAALQVITGAGVDLNINNQSVGDLSGTTTITEALEQINANVSGVTAGSFTELAAASDGTGIISGTAAPLTITLNNQDGTANTIAVTDTSSMGELVDKLNDVGKGQITASLNADDRLVLVSESGAQLVVTNNAGATAAGIAGGLTQNPQLTLSIDKGGPESVDIAYAGVSAAQILAIGLDTRAGGDITGQAAVAGGIAEGEIKINGVDIGAVVAGGSPTAQATNVVAAINAKSDEHGVVASSNGAVISLNSVSGDEITVDYVNPGATGLLTGIQETFNTTTQGNSVSDIDILTAEAAQDAIDVIDVALETINSTRSEMGAANNRLDFTISNLMNVSENTAAARSRIVDADFAEETANLSRSQVLQQASQAMLAQANAQPQRVLQLLNN